jgi:hypothetical protein
MFMWVQILLLLRRGDKKCPEDMLNRFRTRSDWGILIYTETLKLVFCINYMSNNMYTVFTSYSSEMRIVCELYVFTKANNETDTAQL